MNISKLFTNVFSDKYLLYIVSFEFCYKYQLYICCMMQMFVYFLYSDMFKFDIYVFSRFYRVIRMSFNFDFIIFNKTLRKYMNNRKHIYYLNGRVYNIIFSNFSILFDILIFKFFRVFLQYGICFYSERPLRLLGLKLSWIDINSIIIDLYDTIFFRESFFFRYEIFRVIYKIYINCINDKNNFIWAIVSFLGFKFFFKKKFKFSFYVRII